jgi:hypothetical protein
MFSGFSDIKGRDGVRRQTEQNARKRALRFLAKFLDTEAVRY